MFERTLTVLTDIGIDTAALGVSFTSAVNALQMAVKQGDFDAGYEYRYDVVAR